MKVHEIINSFGKSGTHLSRAILKAKRNEDVAAVCVPQSFPGSLFMERETQMKLLDDLLFQPKNSKEKRNLIVTVAASGMGKSAFVDEYCRRRVLHWTQGEKLSGIIHPIAFSYNIDTFGGPNGGGGPVDVAARLLMSYFVANPSDSLMSDIYYSLQDAKLEVEDVVSVVMECIKEDLRVQSGVAKPKILIACDEVAKNRDEQQIVRLLCSSVDRDDDLECFFTGLSWTPFLGETSSGRDIKYVPLPLLSFKSSLRLVRSFIAGSQSAPVSSTFARLSGGHPRTIQAFEMTIERKGWQNVQWNDSVVETVAESTMALMNYSPLEEDLMLMLHPRTSLKDIIENRSLIDALGEGRLYATIDSDSDSVELLASPLMLRNSLLCQEEPGYYYNKLLDVMKELLTLTGLEDLKEFHRADARQLGKTFEQFYLRIEMIRRGFQSSELKNQKILLVPDLYSSVRYSQNCDTVRFEVISRHEIEDVACTVDFPSSNPADADAFKRVKSLIDEIPVVSAIFRPTKAAQSGYDFFFILKEFSSRTRSIQLIDTSFSAGGKNRSEEFFIARYLKKIEAAESLAWNELGIDVKTIVHTFVSNGDTSGVDWKKEFSDKKYSDRRIVILDRADLAIFFGPMLNVLFRCCFDDEIQAPAGRADEQ